MQLQNEEPAIKKLLIGYAEALNSANVASLPTFYAENGHFMPQQVF